VEIVTRSGAICLFLRTGAVTSLVVLVGFRPPGSWHAVGTWVGIAVIRVVAVGDLLLSGMASTGRHHAPPPRKTIVFLHVIQTDQPQVGIGLLVHIPTDQLLVWVGLIPFGPTNVRPPTISLVR